jgi:uncharacterized delta-60 repeat protein
MKLFKNLPILILVIACAVVSIACSNGKSPITPSSDDVSGISNDLPVSFGSVDESRNLLAVYDAVIDPAAKTFTITPVDRKAQYHLPLTQFYPRVLQITGYGWTPNFWADIKLIHPYPGTGIKGYDPRVIAILPANPSVSFYYPTLNVNANNSVLLEPDGYTKLFDDLTGAPGNVNPFKAYFKNQPNRVWSGTDITEETQRWQMNLAGFGGPLQFKLVVDVSTNYSNPPQPVVDNAPEPIEFNATVGPGLTTVGGSAEITITLIDWQGESSVGGVQVEMPGLYNGTVNLLYSAPGPNPNEYVYTGTIANLLFAPEGEYKYLVAAWDQSTGIYMYNEFSTFVNYDATVDGNLIWTKSAGGSDADSGNGITTLSDNSTVVTGQFKGTATFGPSEPNETILTSHGEFDIFIARYNPEGLLLWAKRAGGTGVDVGYAITTLSDSSILVTGAYRDNAAFGPDEPNETILIALGSYDFFIARYNPDGTLSWAKRAGGYGWDEGYGITTLSDNSVVVTGRFDDGATFGSGESNQTNLTSAGNDDIFIARYNPDGTLSWAKRAGGLTHDQGYGITTLLDNSIVITGYFEGATFGEDEPNETRLHSAGYQDIFIAKYNPDGTLVWVKRAGGSSHDQGYGITTLLDNSIVITGYFSDSAIFGPLESNETILTSDGGEDIFIARYNPNGTLSWAKRAGGVAHDRGYGITTLSDNSTVVTGYFYGSATFGPFESNETVLTSAIEWDIFIARYNPDGTLAWAKRAGGSGDDRGYGITRLSDNSTVVTGNFGYYSGVGTATFGPDEPNQTVLTSAGGLDIFIARFEP